MAPCKMQRTTTGKTCFDTILNALRTHCGVIISRILTFQYFCILRFVFTSCLIQQLEDKHNIQLFPPTQYLELLKYTSEEHLNARITKGSNFLRLSMLQSTKNKQSQRPKRNNRLHMMSSSVVRIHLAINEECNYRIQFMFPNANMFTMIVQISRSLPQLLLNIKHGSTTNASVKTIPAP